MTHWSTRRLAKQVGVSHATVHRVWQAHDLKPHHVETFKFSKDAHLKEKVIDMPLNFPAIEDVHLARAPLREVICQVRFPTILRIAQEEPVALQERIRTRFPRLEVERDVIIEMQGLKAGGRVGFPPPAFRFLSQDGACAVSLMPDFYALSSMAYRHWAEFADKLAYVAEAVQAVYALPYATRIGLRYINVLDAQLVGSGEFSDVLDLLRDELTVMLRTEAIPEPELAVQRIETKADGDRFTFRYGLIREGTPPKPKFLLDFDHYVEGYFRSWHFFF